MKTEVMKQVLAGLMVFGLGLGVRAGAEPRVEGRVRLNSGEPAAGAQVRLFDLRDLRQVVAATTDESGSFLAVAGALAGRAGLAGTVQPGAELSQSVQSFHDHSLSTAGFDTRAVGRLQPAGPANCEARR